MDEDTIPVSRAFAELLDSKFTVPGTKIRFGMDPLLGLIPGAGDWLTGLFSIYFLVMALRQGGDSPVLIRMFFNILLDIVVGSIPLVGDVFDVAWKANLKNAHLLEEVAQNPSETQTKSQWFNWLLMVLFAVIILGLLVLISVLIMKVLNLLLGR